MLSNQHFFLYLSTGKSTFKNFQKHKKSTEQLSCIFVTLKKVKLKKFLVLIMLLSVTCISRSQDLWNKKRLEFPPVICYASDKTEKSFIPPPREFLLKSTNEKKSEFIVTYSLFPANAKPALEYAISIWEQLLQSDVPIRMKINWRSLGTNTLAQGGPADYSSNFENAPYKNRFYPVVVVERITGKEYNSPSVSDIEITFNKDIKWYLGTDGQTPSELYDFVTVALHEIGHGLGFTGFFFVTGDKGAYGNYKAGDIAAFDAMVTDGINRRLIDTTFYQLATQKLYNALTSQALFSESISAKSNSGRSKTRLYAPPTWSDGSSVYHLDDDTYPHTDENSLMTHAIGKGEANHNPGPITRGILDDIGWNTMILKLERPKDTETLKPLVFKLNIDSDNEIDIGSVKLHYSTNSSKTKDSVLFIQGNDTQLLEAVIDPKPGTTKIDYYVSAGDVVKRTFYSPSEAPGEIYSVRIGADTEAPVISHSPFSYFISNGNSIQISSNIDDNLGIDTAFVEFSVNGVPGKTFGLINDSASFYIGDFGILPQSLNDGDIVEYRIFAIDSSLLKNQTINPESGAYSFRIEKIFSPVKTYSNDFNSETPDFVLSDFDIYTASGFINGALQSPHPYPSPDKDNAFLNFFTLLKYPVILNNGSTMSFDEVVLVEPGEKLSKFGDDDFWDYVIVEGSNDNGKTWLPLADGYDSRSNTIWETNYNKNMNDQVSTTAGVPEWFINRQINLVENGNFNAGDTILIRFRLYSDPYAHGWGWTIDNLRIQAPVGNHEVQLTPQNIVVYPNPFTNSLNIDFDTAQQIGNLKIEIVNIYGQTVSKNSFSDISGSFIENLDLQHLSDGMYLLIINADGKRIFQQKIVKSVTKN